MTEREKNEICKGYADLIIKKEQLIREIWKTEFAIKSLEDVLKRNKILTPKIGRASCRERVSSPV